MNASKLYGLLKREGLPVVGFSRENDPFFDDCDPQVDLANDMSVQISAYDGTIEYSICQYDPTAHTMTFSEPYRSAAAVVRALKSDKRLSVQSE